MTYKVLGEYVVLPHITEVQYLRIVIDMLVSGSQSFANPVFSSTLILLLLPVLIISTLFQILITAYLDFCDCFLMSHYISSLPHLSSSSLQLDYHS